MKRLEITPILDLMHFRVPDWLGNFQNPELPIHFAEYAGAVAERYPWVKCYTPVNEDLRHGSCKRQGRQVERAAQG